MAGQAHRSKRKITYFEHKDVHAELERIAKEEGEKRGHKIYWAELIRNMTLELANEHRKKRNAEPIAYDPSSGKFAPAGVPMPDQAVVDAEGRLTVYDKKNGKVMNEWKKVAQVPELLRRFPRVKFRYR
jgi:hypothetical protein